ncbi:MAG: 5-oxoprolinase subunit PxpA [Bacteroidota bacterium]
MKQLRIDINCDMGESYGRFSVGNDEQIFPWISSSNIACGFHGGDPFHIEHTIRLALKHKVRIGAHPGYPDLQGFGRRDMKIPAQELRAIIKYQIAAVKGLTESLGGRLAYVKPHGALYNAASRDAEETKVILQAIQEIDSGLAFMGLAGSVMQRLAKEAQLPFIAEAFADRRYEPDGKLMSRSKSQAVIQDPDQAVEQVLSIFLNQAVHCSDGSVLPMEAQSFCIHGDNPAAPRILKALDTALAVQKIEKLKQER